MLLSTDDEEMRDVTEQDDVVPILLPIPSQLVNFKNDYSLTKNFCVISFKYQ